MRTTSFLTAAVVAAATLAACSKNAPETAPAPAAAPNPDSVAKARAADSAAAAQAKAAAMAKARQDSIDAAKGALEQAKAAARAEFAYAVYFDFDKSALTDSAKKVLDRKIQIMNANPGVGIQIEGNTDERGSAEYNLALGQQRAASVKRYLTQHGIADSRITILSNGEEKPADQGHDESAWSHNRRAEFVITVGDLAPTP
ncbi:MAG TPA: peptidoglycan-associated lipoprotein Pal [Gemmatimonadaceae bacterium]|nr:peptidoglycan-associated lipoprotein Pal [Gemmatimonadaceae bacterium]